MPTGNYSAIITAIDTVLNSVSSIKEKYKYEPQQFTKYPAVTISPLGHTEEYLSLRDTRRQYSFMIRVWGQMDGTRTDTQVVVRDIADQIINELGKQSNITLGGVCDYSELSNCAFRYVQRESSFFVAEITYKCQKAYVRGV